MIKSTILHVPYIAQILPLCVTGLRIQMSVPGPPLSSCYVYVFVYVCFIILYLGAIMGWSVIYMILAFPSCFFLLVFFCKAAL